MQKKNQGEESIVRKVSYPASLLFKKLERMVPFLIIVYFVSRPNKCTKIILSQSTVTGMLFVSMKKIFDTCLQSNI